MQGQQGLIHEIDNAVAVDVAGEAAVVAGIGGAVVIHIGSVVVGVAPTVRSRRARQRYRKLLSLLNKNPKRIHGPMLVCAFAN